MPDNRKPRLIVTGEFSAGKTKLINGLIGIDVLPSNVISTSLPPVWLMGGRDVSFRVDLDGEMQPAEAATDVSVDDTLVYVRSADATILDHVDIIDTPGNSDPNIPAESWERMIGYADMLIWCTGATQAWRQSEKSTVRELPEALLDNSMLVITQADRIPDANSARKLERRVNRDAGQYFGSVRMASLIDADDVEALRAHVIEMATAANARPGNEFELVELMRPKPPKRLVMPTRAKAEIDKLNIFAKPSGRDQAPDDTAEIRPIGAYSDKPVTAPKPDLPPEIVSASPKPVPTSAKAMWQSFVGNRDMNKPDDILAGIAAFLSELDETYRLAPLDADEPLRPVGPDPVRSKPAQLTDSAPRE